MKTKRTKKLLAFLITTAMAMMMMSSFVYADEFTYTPKAAPTGVTFDKVLALPADSPIPDVGFAFAVSTNDVTEVAATEDTFGIKKGIDTPTISNVTFSSSDTKDNPVDSRATAKGARYNSSCTKEVSVDFGNITFPEPGVYRYKITETAATGYANVAVGYDTFVYMDVFVPDESTATEKKLGDPQVIFVRPSGTSGAVPTTAGAYPTGDTKTDAFVNTYPTNTLSVGKEVAGNQGSKDQFFGFTITLTAPASETIDDNVILNVVGQTKQPVGNAATKYTDMSSNDVDTLTWAQLSAGYTIYLQHGETVEIQGIPDGCSATIVEDNEDYTVSTEKTVGTTKTTGTSATVSANITSDVSVDYTNTKNGTIPTGIIISVAGLLIVGIIAVIGFVFFGTRSKRRYEED